MPIYEYQCQHCGHHIEKLQKVSDAPLKHCDVCGRDTLSKLVSSPSFQLKGEGWYVTDFRDKSKKSKTETSTEGETAVSSDEKSAKAETSKTEKIESTSKDKSKAKPKKEEAKKSD